MVKIVHLADSHLGYRARKGTSDQWAIKNYSKPYEQNIYDTFLKIIENITKIDDVDFVVHCGDMFHTPHKNNPFAPSEPARMTLKNGLDLFFKNTNNKIPFIYIEGNHGIYRTYDYTPFETQINKEEYPNLFYFKERDLLNAIRGNKSLYIEFNKKRVKFYLFPYFEFKTFESYEKAYNRWIINQKANKADDFVNIAVAHGSRADQTLHPDILGDLNYDYIALGHEHGMKKVNDRCYFTGTLIPLNFKEIYENHGYLIININEASRNISVEKVNTEKLVKRDFKIIDIEVSPSESSTAISGAIEKELNNYSSTDGFNPRTSARLNLNFTGELTYETVWTITNIMSRLRRECFSHPEKYNILQLIWRTRDISELVEDKASTGIVEDYILMNPGEEFKEYVEEVLKDDRTNYQVDKLTEFGINAIKKALNVDRKEKED